MNLTSLMGTPAKPAERTEPDLIRERAGTRHRGTERGARFDGALRDAQRDSRQATMAVDAQVPSTSQPSASQPRPTAPGEFRPQSAAAEDAAQVLDGPVLGDFWRVLTTPDGEPTGDAAVAAAQVALNGENLGNLENAGEDVSLEGALVVSVPPAEQQPTAAQGGALATSAVGAQEQAKAEPQTEESPTSDTAALAPAATSVQPNQAGIGQQHPGQRGEGGQPQGQVQEQNHDASGDQQQSVVHQPVAVTTRNRPAEAPGQLPAPQRPAPMGLHASEAGAAAPGRPGLELSHLTPVSLSADEAERVAGLVATARSEASTAQASAAQAATNQAATATATQPAAPSAESLPVVNLTAPSATAPVTQAAQTGAAGGGLAPTQAQLVAQLGGQMSRIRELAPGEHVLTMRVNPETFGPVRVVAHIGSEGVRIELLGATDAAREALRGALSDLRRDLAATGLKADLQLHQDGHRERGSAAAGQDAAAHREGTAGREASARTSQSMINSADDSAGAQAQAAPHGPHGSDHRLDLIA